MMIQDDETLQMYTEEANEHLETIESDLLVIEQGGESIDEELVNKVFRAAHSIKGGAGFLGLKVIKELAHKIENILDMIRNEEMVPTADVVNTVLLAFDRLGALINDASNSNDEDISENIEALSTLLGTVLSEEEQETVTAPTHVTHVKSGTVFESTIFDLNNARKGGKNIYILEYDLVKDVHEQDKTPLDVINSLNDAGEILDIKVGIAAVGDLDSLDDTPVIPMLALFSSIIEPDLLAIMTSLPEEKITLIPREEVQQEPPVLEKTERSSVPETPPSGKEAASAPPKQAEEKPAAPAKKPASKKSARPAGKAEKKRQTITKAESLRVAVPVLDQLMNRAGELVLARNQLLQSIANWDKQAVSAAGQRLDQVTSELQEAIMLTRMQPIANIFNKYPRVVRDLSRDLGKQIDLVLEGKEVELDKTIIEGLGDPMTHLVRNSCDHGIELPDDRVAKGKPQTGKITLRAFHESGQIVIEIEDDGKGLDPDVLCAKAIKKGLITEAQAQPMSDQEKSGLIMLPGFSTAEQVTDVSGRGVGMDVVKSNLDEMGGQVELISQLGKGTTIRIKLPLTLAIIPSLLISTCGKRFALPQVNVGELIRIPAPEIREKIEKVGDADVLLLRGELIPLLQLGNVLELSHLYYDNKTGEFRPDRRKTLIDRRLVAEDAIENVHDDTPKGSKKDGQIGIDERRASRQSDVNIVILQAGKIKFGLVVDEVHDTIEIVVKPLGRHLGNCAMYAGATIMGDGHVALILDVAGLADKAELSSLNKSTEQVKREAEGQTVSDSDGQSLLLFHNGPDEYCAVPLHTVLRIEQIQTADIEVRGGKKVVQYRGRHLPVFGLEEVANVARIEHCDELTVILFLVAGHEVGLLSVPPLDVVETDAAIDQQTLKQPGISGSAIINDKTTLLVDIYDLIRTLNPHWFTERMTMNETSGAEQAYDAADKTILLAEDSAFFRKQIAGSIESEGYQVVATEDGAEAWEYLTTHGDEIDLIVTDLQMPNMDGLELTRKIKADSRFKHMRVTALTSLAAEEDRAKGLEAGIDDYQVKLDKEQLLQGIFEALQG